MSVRSCTVSGRDEAIYVSGKTWMVTSLRAVRRDLYTPPKPFLRGVAEAALHCAHRTSTVSSCAFREQEGWSGGSPPSPLSNAVRNSCSAFSIFWSVRPLF
jgi:hypothetical protein